MTEIHPADLTLGRYGCPLCPERFESVGDKKRHIRDDHTDTTKETR